MAFNPRPQFLLRLFLAFVLAGTVVSVQAEPKGEPQAAAPDEGSLDDIVRQCDEAWQRGRWVDAKKLCLAVLERADQLPDSNPKKARVLFQVVPIYYRSDDDKPQAISLLQRIVAIDETALGPEDPQVALDLRELGIQQQFLKPVDAEKSFERAVTIAEGAQHMNSALRMHVFVGASQFCRPRMGISFFAVILIAWECEGRANAGEGRVRSEMSEKVVAQFKKLLLARRLELSRNLNQTVEEVRAAETAEGGEPGDDIRRLAPELLQQGTHAQGMLMAMDAALARIASGTFGRCMTCGEEIGSRRLVAFPWIQYCLGCQHIEEKRRQTPVPAR